MNTREYQQCTRCVMDTTDPQIKFDDTGQCNHCTEFITVRKKYIYLGEKGEEQLARVIGKMKKDGKGREYDCLLGVSGGVDSSYAAYICRENGLRALCVHMDNGWNSEEANLNIKNITRKLDLDYESYVLDWEEFKDLQLSFLKASVPEAETPTDMGIVGTWHKVAAKYGIKYIISGGNMVNEGILPRCWHYNGRDTTYLNAIHDKFGKVKLKNFPTYSFLQEMYYKLFRGINIVYLLQYVPYVKNDAMALLKDKLDWKYYGGKHYESRYTRFIQSYYLYEKFGIDYRRATLSSQICVGEISRDKALEELKERPYDPQKIEEDKKYIAKKLGIPIDEFETILKAPGKFYFEYPNSEKFLDFIYTAYRKIYKKEKTANF
jgi:N-acetyl sugar amidotransferase